MKKVTPVFKKRVILHQGMELFIRQSSIYIKIPADIYVKVPSDINGQTFNILVTFNNVSKYELIPNTESYFNNNSSIHDVIGFAHYPDGFSVINEVEEENHEKYYALDDLDVGLLKIWADGFEEDFSLKSIFDTTNTGVFKFGFAGGYYPTEYLFTSFSAKFEVLLFIKFVCSECVDEEFCGEVKNSEWLAYILKTNTSEKMPKNLHHYRINMNNFGYLDIIAKNMTITDNL